MAVMMQDSRFALRTLFKRPLLLVVALVSLAASVGITTAVYSVANAWLNRSPGGVFEPERLVTLRAVDVADPSVGQLSFSLPQYKALRDVQDAFTDVAAYGKVLAVVSDERQSHEAVAELVTGNYFALLGLRPALGRFVLPEDDVTGAAPAVVLSHQFWMSRFGGDPGVVGAPIQLNGRQGRIIGVAAREFGWGYNLDWNGPTSLWVPMHANIGEATRLVASSNRFFILMGRLRPGVTLAVARDKAQSWATQLPAAQSRNPTTGILALPSGETRVRQEREPVQRFFAMLLTVSGLILLAACFNVASFMLGRFALRKRELAVRTALGASRWRLFRLLITEVSMFGMCAITLALVVTVWLTHLFSASPRLFLNRTLTNEELIEAVPVDFRMAGVLLAIGLGATVLAGVFPALLTLFRDRPAEALKDTRPQVGWRLRRVTVPQVLLIIQVALSIALGTTAALYVDSFASVAALDAGYTRPDSVLLARVFPSALGRERGTQFYRELLERLNATPEVEVASIGWNPPFSIGRSSFSVPGRDGGGIEGGSTAVAPRFFEAHGLRMFAGREFEHSEDDFANGVIVNRVLANALWPQQDPLGQSLNVANQVRRVIGVTSEDVCEDLLVGPTPCAWRPFPMGATTGYLRIRLKSTPSAFVPTLRRIVHELNPNVAIAEEIPLDGYLQQIFSKQRTLAVGGLSLALFGMLLLGLGCASLFISMVRNGVREIAIRIALGESRRRMILRVVLSGVHIIVAGALLGLVGARLLIPRVADQLYATSATAHVSSFLFVSVMVALIGVTALLYAALIAIRTQPSRVLADAN